MNAGDTFFFTSPGQDSHLWIVISDPEYDRQSILLVNVTTWRRDKDQSCILEPGDHPFVTRNSIISYQDSHAYADNHLEHLVATKKIALQDVLSAEVLKRVREGAGNSRHMRLDHGKILLDQGLID